MLCCNWGDERVSYLVKIWAGCLWVNLFLIMIMPQHFFFIQAWACYEFSMSILQLISFIKYCITGFVLASGRSILCNGNCCVDGGGITFLCGKCLAQIVAIEKHPWWGYIVDNEWPRVSDRVQAVLFINFGVWSVTWCELVYE